MLGFFSSAISIRAKTYVAAVVALGIPLFLYSLFSSFQEHGTSWLYLAVLTILGSAFPVTIPSTRERTQSLSVTISDVFLFSSLL